MKSKKKSRESSRLAKEKSRKIPFWAKFTIGEEKDYFIENLAVLINAGMDILSAVKAIRLEVRSKSLLKIIDNLEEDIEAGLSIWRALEKIHFLPTYVVSLVRIGEETGRLSDNLRVIVSEQQKSRIFRSKIRSAMLYPTIVFFLTITVGVGVAWFILPRLAQVFATLHLKLPIITSALIAVGRFLGSYGAIAVPIFLAALALLIYIFFFAPKTRFLGQAIFFRLPQIKKLIQQVELARLGFMLGTLLKAGLPIVQALTSLRDAANFYLYKKFYAFLRNSIEEGNSFQKSFSFYPHSRRLIPVPIQEMIVTGEQSGRLAAILLNIGELFETKSEITTKNLAVLLEPILLVVVWLGVVAVSLAIILPIYNLIGGLSSGR